VKSKVRLSVNTYSSDLEDNFIDEFSIISSSSLYKDKKLVAELMKSLIKGKLVTSFTNVNIAFRIYLSIIGSNVEGEISFSKLKKIKNYMPSTLKIASRLWIFYAVRVNLSKK
jgi:hypothetical protein